MKKITVLAGSFIAALGFTGIALAENPKVEVTWTDPDKYIDIEPTNATKKSFRKQLFRSLDKHFSELAAELPEGQTLKVDVTNLDLAGDVRYISGDEVRIVKPIYFPRIKFSYQLLDEGKVISEQQVDLKDMGFLFGILSIKYRDRSFGYEKQMLDEWFDDTFKKELMAKS